MRYSDAQKEAAVLFYECGNTFAETKKKFGMSESTFYEWKKKFDLAHPVPETAGNSLSVARKAQLHLDKLVLELEVLRQCPCGINASIDDKMAAIDFYNGYRPHRKLNMKTPIQYEREFYSAARC